MKRKLVFVVLLVAVWFFAFSPIAYPEEKGFPNKAIQMITPHAAGGLIDFFSRKIAEKFKEKWKVPVNVINKTAAGGALAAEEVAGSKKDGYTLFIGFVSTLATMTAANPNGPINLLRDFTPVLINHRIAGSMLLAKADSEFKSIKDIVAYAHKNPGKLICSSGMVGTDAYLMVEAFKREAKINIIHLSFPTTAENVNSVLGGHVHLAIIPEFSALPLVESGKLRGFATDIETLSFPNVPTFLKQGYDHISFESSAIILGPKGLPSEIIDIIEGPLNELSKDTQFVSSCRKVGIDVNFKMGAKTLNTLLNDAVQKYSLFTPEELGWAKPKK